MTPGPFAPDIAALAQVMRGVDPAFAALDPTAIEGALAAMQGQRDRDGFLLAAMRGMALAGNAHSRVIPNPAIRVFPLRFVAWGQGYALVRAPGLARPQVLTGIGGVGVDEVVRRAAPYLAGPPARRSVIGGLLLAWPGALAALGLAPPGGSVTWHLADTDGRATDLRLPPDALVPAEPLYPLREHGRADPSPPVDFVTLTDAAPGVVHLRLADLHDPQGARLGAQVAAAADRLAHSPPPGLIVDLRGNPGGNFTLALPLVAVLAQVRAGHRTPVLVDRFTFSAALVTVARLRAALGADAVLMGEGMGDTPRFWAEGGSQTLPGSGAILRHSDAWHDWQTGVPGPSTPATIAQHLVAAGEMEPDVALPPGPPDGSADPVLTAAVGLA